MSGATQKTVSSYASGYRRTAKGADAGPKRRRLRARPAAPTDNTSHESRLPKLVSYANPQQFTIEAEYFYRQPPNTVRFGKGCK